MHSGHCWRLLCSPAGIEIFQGKIIVIIIIIIIILYFILFFQGRRDPRWAVVDDGLAAALPDLKCCKEKN
jgi:hypothetical protein